MIISATKFSLKSWRIYGEFFINTYRVAQQVKAAGSIIRMKINPVSLRTITAWKTEADMLKFRNSGAHMDAMRKTRSFGAISSVVWESGTMSIWKEAIQRLAAHESQRL